MFLYVLKVLIEWIKIGIKDIRDEIFLCYINIIDFYFLRVYYFFFSRDWF